MLGSEFGAKDRTTSSDNFDRRVPLNDALTRSICYLWKIFHGAVGCPHRLPTTRKEHNYCLSRHVFSNLLQRCGAVTKNRSGVGFAPLNDGNVYFGLGENENR